MELSQLNPRNWFSKAVQQDSSQDYIVSDLEGYQEKLNPAQSLIAAGQGSQAYTSFVVAYREAFTKIESVRRGVDLIVNGCSSLDYDVKDSLNTSVVKGVKQKTLHRLLNFEPNPYQSQQSFRMNIFTDFILEGNAFLYFDGAYLYHLPAANMQINTDPTTYIKSYSYNGMTDFKPDEIIHLADTSAVSIYRGTSRLQAASNSIKTLYSMRLFQQQFFDNGAIPGIILETENTLSATAKVRTVENWKKTYNPRSGARTPIIIDNGLKVKSLNDVSFKELDFEASIASHEVLILKALGVPPILLDGGNNANINPNMRLFYLETVLPIARKYVSALERYFGYDIEAITATVSALQPDIRELASYYSTLVNGGIMTPAEAREALRLTKLPDKSLEEIRVPANIAGSATNPDTGGAPKKDPNATP